MTRNKKKLRRLERLAGAAKTGGRGSAARTLAVTGLLLGGLMVAPAQAVVTWGENVDVVVDNDVSLSAPQHARNLTVNKNQTLTLGTNHVLTSEGAGNVTILGTVVSTGGAIQGIQPQEPWAYYGTANVAGALNFTGGGSLSALDITLDGGETSSASTLNGQFSSHTPGVSPHPDTGLWRDNAMVYAGHGLTLNNTTVTLGVDGGLLGAGTSNGGAGQHVTLGKGAVVNMAGSDVAHASVLHAFGDATLNIVDGGAVNVTGIGAVGSATTTISGLDSRIYVDGGGLEMIDKLPDGQGAHATAVTSGLTFTSGALNLADGGRVRSDAITVNGGVITADGAHHVSDADGGARSGLYGKAADGMSGVLTMTSGALNLLNGGGAEVETVKIDGGTVTISGRSDALNKTGLEAWRTGSALVGMKDVTISTGTVNVGDYGMIVVGNGSSGDHGVLTVAGGLVNLQGTAADRAALLRATPAGQAPDDTAGELKITGGVVNVAAGHYGIIAAADAAVGGGSVSVARGGHLTLLPKVATTGFATAAPDAGLSFAQGAKLSVSNGLVTVADNMNLGEGTLALSGTGSVDVAGALRVTHTGDLDSSAFGSGGALRVGSLVLSDAAKKFTVAGASPALTFTGLGADQAFFQGSELAVNGAALTLEGAGGTVTKLSLADVASSALQVRAGEWTVAELGVAGTSNAALGVGGGASKAILTVNGITPAAAGDKAATTIGNLGSLVVNAADVYDGTAVTSLGQMSVAAGGTLTVKGDGGALTSAKAAAMKSALMTGGGLWDLQGYDITLADSDFVNGDPATDTLTESAAFMVGTSTAQEHAVQLTAPADSAGNVAAGTSLGARSLVVDAAAVTGDTVTVATAPGASLALSGAGAGSSLIAAAGNDAIATTNLKVDGGTLTLEKNGGTLNGDISADGASATVNVTDAAFAVAGDINLSGATTSLLNVSDGATLNASGDVMADTLNLTGANLSAGGNVESDELNLRGAALNASGDVITALNASNASLTARGLTLSGDSSLGGGSVANVGNLDLRSRELAVGDGEGGATLIADNITLNSGILAFDPPFVAAGDTSNASLGGLSFQSSTIDGTVITGQNSMVTLGSQDAEWLRGWVNERQSQGDVLWGDDVTAALAVRGPQTLARGSNLAVDGAYTHAASGTYVTSSQVFFGDRSLLVVDAPSLHGQAALSAAGAQAVTVEGAAKLALSDAAAGSVYTILDGFDPASTIADGGWQGTNLMVSSYLQSLTLRNNLATDGSVAVAVSNVPAASVLPNISSGMANLVDSLYAQGLNGVASPNAGVKFVSRATDLRYMDKTGAARVLESAAQPALAGGAPSVALDAVAAATGAAAERTSLAVPGFSRQAGLATSEAGHSFGVWAMPLFRSTEIDGQKAGSFTYGVDSDLWGGAIGADVTNEGTWGRFRLGVALNVGGGDATSHGDLYKTKNDFDFWGALAYAGWRLNNLGLSADLGYTAVSNDIKQDTNRSLGLGDQFKSTVDADVYSLGLKAEYVIPTAFADITPSLGVRYNAYRQHRHNVDSALGTVFNLDKADMDTWTFPIGVKFSRDFVTTGWSIRPELNLAVIPAAGDTKLDSKASIPGLAVSPAGLSGHVLDDWTGEAGLGLSVARENVSFGLNYGFQGSENRTSHSVFGTLRFEF